MDSNDTTAPGAAPVSNDAIGGAGAEPKPSKPRWDPKGKRNMMIVGGVVVTAFSLLIVLFSGGESAEEKKPSNVVEAPAEAIPGTMLSEADREELRKQENARIAAALSGGQSAIGNTPPVSTVSTPSIQQQPSEVRLDQQPQQPPVSPNSAPTQAAASTDQAKVEALEKQMNRIMDAWGVGGGSGQRVLSTYVREPSKTNSGSGNGNGARGAVEQGNGGAQHDSDDVMVIKAYEQPYAAEMISATDSDTPGKLRARIQSGPLAGAVLTGAARRIGTQGFQADFNTASFNGRTFKVVAYGMDGEVAGDVVKGEYDGRYMQRYVFPVLAEGVKAYAGARAQVGTTVIAIPIPGAGGAGIVTGGQQTPTPSAEQARNAMYSSGANQVSRALATGPQDGHVTLASGTQIGIVFEESVYQSDLAGRARNNK
ncbi:DotG/IcmE/VirB10 family protein [Massilia varians]|uniref:DotG/IcmE/VirB10 family protein n=1 Tax=Massilia varians TaxID=457921 RepID=UPI00255546D5|nr:DotG/IcmE/VirB10 family protein [Massilia varians]MDK6076224.1 DotG/IcmE/VirB10 family protein [Massilia varians]